MAARNDVFSRPPARPVPMVVSVGGEEPAGWQAQSAGYADLAEAAGCAVERVTVPGANHFSMLFDAVSAGRQVLRGVRGEDVAGRGTWCPKAFAPPLFPSCPHIVIPGLVPGISLGRFRRTAAWMPGTSPRLSGLDLGDRAHGLDSTGFRGVRRDRDPDRRPAARPCSRHTRTCSGYPYGRLAEPLERDTRNKSGYDERACPEPVEGGAFGHDGQEADRGRRALPKSRSAPPQCLNRTPVEQVRV